MRIVSWNCNMKLREKYEQITCLDADIYVIQECENPDYVNHAGYKDFASNYLWTGDNKNKGMGIFARKGINLDDNNWNSYCLRNFVSFRVNQEFDMLAVWAADPYIAEYYVYQNIHFDRYSPNMIIIGDFNSNTIWDKKNTRRNHSTVVAELKQKGLESIYHHIYQEKQGEETQKTFYLYRHLDRGYHIDHCFANPERVKAYRIDGDDDWLKYSDHLPIILDV